VDRRGHFGPNLKCRSKGLTIRWSPPGQLRKSEFQMLSRTGPDFHLEAAMPHDALRSGACALLEATLRAQKWAAMLGVHQ